MLVTIKIFLLLDKGIITDLLVVSMNNNAELYKCNYKHFVQMVMQHCTNYFWFIKIIT